MDILEIIQKRRSIREYQERPIPENILTDLIEALRWAPSAGNLQSRYFYFVFDPDLRRKLAAAALDQEFMARAPLVIVACADRRIAGRYGRRGRELYMIQDVAAGVQNLLLVAHARGLGTVWVGAFEEERVGRLLKLPEHLRPVALVPVGYPGEEPEVPSRLSAGEIARMIR